MQKLYMINNEKIVYYKKVQSRQSSAFLLLTPDYASLTNNQHTRSSFNKKTFTKKRPYFVRCLIK